MAKFNIKVEMEDRWVDTFLSMLDKMEIFGDIGSSRIVGIYSDGDGDFRPKFEADIEYKSVNPKKENDFAITYDAG